MSNRRFQLFGISNARAVQADAEQLPLPDSSIDFVWSWGVIHHSSNTDRIVGEIYRALRPGGRAQIMIYHRNSTRYWIHGLYHAIILGKILKYKTLYAVNMTFTDGYIARHYSRGDCYNLFGKFSGIKTSVMDSGYPSIVFGWGRLSRILPSIFGPINRWINRRFGWFLVVDLVK
jgi:SAM-dependent methyltransferase